MVIHNDLMTDSIPCHFICSAIAGFVAATIGQPVDLVKTRVMNLRKPIMEVIRNEIAKDVEGV